MYKTQLFIIFSFMCSYSIASNNTSCKLCTDIVDIINSELHLANSTINIIEEVVQTFCNHMIIPFRKHECLFILDNLQNIINWLLDGLSPNDICTKIGFC